MTTTLAGYLARENERNAANRALYTEVLRAAGLVNQEQGGSIIAHHLCFSTTTDDGKFVVEEIPSADTLIFCHEIMRTVFGENYLDVMMLLASLPQPERDETLRELFNHRTEIQPVPKGQP